MSDDVEKDIVRMTIRVGRRKPVTLRVRRSAFEIVVMTIAAIDPKIPVQLYEAGKPFGATLPAGQLSSFVQGIKKGRRR